MASGDIFDINAILKDAAIGAIIGLCVFLYYSLTKSGRNAKKDQAKKNDIGSGLVPCNSLYFKCADMYKRVKIEQVKEVAYDNSIFKR